MEGKRVFERFGRSLGRCFGILSEFERNLDLSKKVKFLVPTRYVSSKWPRSTVQKKFGNTCSESSAILFRYFF